MINNTLLTITIGSHFFSIRRLTPRARVAVFEFAKKYTKYGLQKTQRNTFSKAAIAVFGAATKDREEFRFHINQLKEFYATLKLHYITDNLIETIHKEIKPGELVPLVMRPEWTARDYQIPIIEYLESNKHLRSKLVDIQTGKGKSFISLNSVCLTGQKTAVIVRPMYIDKWVNDIVKHLDIDPAKIMVVQGSAQLQALLNLAKSNMLDDIYIFVLSNKTYQNWLKLYENYKRDTLDMGYECLPEDLFEFLKVGTRIIDEVHLDFHLNFKMDLYTNVERSISLSATLLSKDPFMNKVYEIAYPLEQRYKGLALDKYIDSKAIFYYTQPHRKIRAAEYGSTNYSHNAFEESIMKDRELMNNYFELIAYTIEIGFMKDYVKGQKVIIFAYKTDFCTLIVNFLAKRYPQFDIRRFTADDPEENMHEPDIRVTTLGSGSTAHDISNLKVAILTVAVDSVQSNIQALGRLRKLEGVTPRFYYFVCQQIPKHIQYHEAKRQLLDERAKSFNIISAPFSL